jgi:hypothetical protein
MRIKSITAHRIGPFYEPFTLGLDERVTIVTGANDVGKSSLLRALELALTENAADDAFINHDHVQESQKAWSKDESITVEALVNLSEAVDIQNGGHQVAAGDHARIRRILAKDVAKTHTQTQLRHHGGSEHLRIKLPAIVKPGNGGGSRINDIIDLKKPGQLEQALLDAAFKARFDFTRLADMKPLAFTRAIRDAQEVLNRLLERVLPYPGMIKFDLLPVEGDRSRLGILVRDRHDGITPFGTRGAGVQRMITLAAELITYHRGAHHKLVLIDEPENSLHPDAQHLLREFLFGITSDGRTQVVYSTHSAAMINPMRGEQVRVLVRAKAGATATTKLLSRPTDANFLGLRTSLGMSPADSLLFAPVTVITEGATEVGCLPKLIEKLEPSGILAPLDLRRLSGLTTFMDGMGDSFEFLCRFAKAHGARVVLFLDGDKRARVSQLRMTEHHPDVPIVHLPGASEFEELVPAGVYLRALAELTGIALPADAEQQIAAWTGQVEHRSRLAFSKRVEGWFTDHVPADFPTKKAVMQKALELAQPAEINATPIRELFNQIQRLLESTSFA